jgi:hypothetical protein
MDNVQEHNIFIIVISSQTFVVVIGDCHFVLIMPVYKERK